MLLADAALATQDGVISSKYFAGSHHFSKSGEFGAFGSRHGKALL